MRHIIHISMIATLSLGSSCSTTVLKAPSNDLHKSFKSSNTSESEELGIKYIKAQELLNSKKFKEACESFESLADNEKFALKQLAFIKELESCIYTADDLYEIWEEEIDDNSLPRWLKEKYVRTSYELAKQNNVEKFIAHFSYKLSYFEKIQKVKVSLLKKAIEISKELENKDNQEIYENRLYLVAPRYIENVNDKNIYKVARDFERNRNFKKARSLYKSIIKNNKHEFKDIKRAWNRVRLSYKNERKLEVYVQKTFQMVRFLYKKYKSNRRNTEYKDAWSKSVITLSRAVWTRHDRPQAHTILKRIYKEMKKGRITNHQQLSTMYWIFGAMAMEQGKTNRAISNYKQALRFKNISTRHRNKLLWAIPHNYYLKKNYKLSSKLFIQNISRTDDDGFKNKFKFWAAKSLMKINKKKQARDFLFELAQNNEFGYYGIVAHKELNLAFKPFKQSVPLDTSFHNTFEWLISLNEKKVAQAFLDFKRPTFKKASDKWAALQLYKRADYNNGMIRLYFNLPEDQRKELLKTNPRYAFPNPFSDLISKAQKKYKVSKNLIYAISRQESSFNPLARSWADAFGLMQLLPERAQTLKRKYKIPYRTPEDLYVPNINISFGASLLQNLKARFKHFPLYVASYNASDKAVTRWHNERFDGDYIDFIEKIPYAETQKYVKLVLRNFFIYKRIHSKNNFYFNEKFFSM